MEVKTGNGTRLILVEPAIKSGGEGSVYLIRGFPGVVAKIYHSKDDAKEREKKICKMAAISETTAFKNTGILDAVAWPLAPLFDSKNEFVGYGMNIISAQNELDNIYSLSNKTSAGMNTEEKIKVAISLCSVVEKLHSNGQVVGDFNPNNMKIDKDCEVKFVDCDSYHFISDNGITYPCVVCAPGYIAPELMKKCKGTTYLECFNNGQVTFNKETDRFALAIHIFRILMNGCHPFNCKLHTMNLRSTPVPSIDKRIENGETPFFVTVSNFTKPDWAPDVTCLPSYLRDLFREAFVDGHKNPFARPSATQWKNALERYQKDIVCCKNDATHYYWKSLKTCPYCTANRNVPNPYPNSNPKKGNSGTGQNAASRTVRVINTNITPTKKVSLNAVLYWFITMTLALVGHTFLTVKAYLPLFHACIENQECADCGAGLSFYAGIIGAIVYSLAWSKAKRYPYKFKLRDYFFAHLTGIVFVIVLCLAFVIFSPIIVFLQENFVKFIVILIIIIILFDL